MKKRIEDIIRAANDGDINSQMLLGSALCAGDGVEKDLGEGLRWLSLAEAAGELQAGYAAALFKMKAKDGSAMEKLKYLEAKGYFPATYELGNCYYNGWFVERDEATAIKLWEAAAEYDHIPSKAKLCAISAQKYGLIWRCIMVIKGLFLVLRYAAIGMRDIRDLRVTGTMM